MEIHQILDQVLTIAAAIAVSILGIILICLFDLIMFYEPGSKPTPSYRLLDRLEDHPRLTGLIFILGILGGLFLFFKYL